MVILKPFFIFKSCVKVRNVKAPAQPTDWFLLERG